MPPLARTYQRLYFQKRAAQRCKLRKRSQDDHNILEEAERYFSEIATFQYVFDRAEQEAAEMGRVSQADLVEFLSDSLRGDSKRALRCVADIGCYLI